MDFNVHKFLTGILSTTKIIYEGTHGLECVDLKFKNMAYDTEYLLHVSLWTHI